MGSPLCCYLLRNFLSVRTCKRPRLLFTFCYCGVLLSTKLHSIKCCINVRVGFRQPLSEDPALAMAFSVARRAAAVPLLLVNGTYRKNIHTYLDSSILQYQLQRLNDQVSLKGGHFLIHSCMEFLFIVVVFRTCKSKYILGFSSYFGTPGVS